MRRNRKFIAAAVLLEIMIFTLLIGSGKIKEAAASVNTGVENTDATVQTLAAEEEKGAEVLYPICVNEDGTIKYGYIDAEGKIIIQPVYSVAHDFSEGLATVYNDQVYQVIDTKGNVIFESEYPIGDFHNGLASFYNPKNSALRGYINTDGKVAIKPAYINAGIFRQDNTAVVQVKDGLYYLINKAGKVLKKYPIKVNYYYSDITDNYIINYDKNTSLEGLVTLQGKVILKPVYGEIDYLGNGLFGVKKAPKDGMTYLTMAMPAAIFNKDGKRLTDYKYYDLSAFTGMYASATDSKNTYFINQSGDKITSLPTLSGRGTMKLIGDIVQADIDNEIFYLKKDGTVIWKNDGVTHLSSGITVSTIKYKPNKYVVVNYPKIEGLSNTAVQKTINSKLLTIFTKYRKNLKESDELSVFDTFHVDQLKDILIINRNGYDYMFGGAHGMPLRDYFMIDVKTGEFYQLKDLFKTNVNYVTTLSKIITKKIQAVNKTDAGAFFEASYHGISKDQKFYLKNEKLIIYFENGEIASYAAGFPEFEIPFKDIRNLINKDGAFWKAFN